MWKSMKSWVRNRCQKWPCVLFGVTVQENKQCTPVMSFIHWKLPSLLIGPWTMGTHRPLPQISDSLPIIFKLVVFVRESLERVPPNWLQKSLASWYASRLLIKTMFFWILHRLSRDLISIDVFLPCFTILKLSQDIRASANYNLD